MSAYIIRRLLRMIPTLFGIMLVSFVVVQFAPGGPIERVLAALSGADTGAGGRTGGGGDFGGRGPGGGGDDVSGKYRGAQGLDPEFTKHLAKEFCVAKPPEEPFLLMLWSY